MIRRAFYVLVLALFTTCAAGQDIRLTPVDEGSSDPTWPRFKSRLLAALQQRDQRYVLSIVDRGIRNYSGTDGVAETSTIGMAAPRARTTAMSRAW